MRVLPAVIALLVAACGSSTDTGRTRYNFAVVDGGNQRSAAGTPSLQKQITSQLTRDPNGTFASRVFDFVAPAKAFAQGLSLAGTPIADQIVCGEETAPGEPKVVPLCAFTLADGRAANSVQGGTKAGVYTMRFTAQVPSQEPVKDSTTVTVEAGPADPNFRITGNPIVSSPATLPASAVVDLYGNAVPYYVVGDANITVSDKTAGSAAARTLTFKDGAAPDGTMGVLELRDGGDVLVGHFAYKIYQPGSYPQPSLTWTTAGINLTP